ncbi:MAG: hypothetical protein PSX71_14095 [bacterium]|nr:hypothetical protein [bacterium]
MKIAAWEKIEQAVIVSLLAFAGFFMWNAGQQLVLLDYRMSKAEHTIEKLKQEG